MCLKLARISWDYKLYYLRYCISSDHSSSASEVFLEKGVLKICSKFTGEHPCRSVKCTSAWVFSCKFAAYFQNIFFLKHFWRTVSVISEKKNCVAKPLQTVWKTFLDESTCNYNSCNSCKLSCKFAFIILLSIRRIPNQELVLVINILTKNSNDYIESKNILAFCL